MAYSRPMVLIGHDPGGKPKYRRISGRSQDEINDKIVQTYVDSGRIWEFIPAGEMPEQTEHVHEKEENPVNQFVDMTGKKIGRLTVIERDKMKGSPKGEAYWVCKCECGNIKSIAGSSLRRGRTRSCGCLRYDKKPAPVPGPIVIKSITPAKEVKSMKILFNTTNGILVPEQKVLAEYRIYVNGQLNNNGIDADVLTLKDWVNMVYAGGLNTVKSFEGLEIKAV